MFWKTICVGLLTTIACLAADPAIRLTPGVPLYISAAEPEPVQRAVKDLQRDLKWILGSESPVRNQLDATSAPGIVIVGPSSEFAQLRDDRISSREAHGVFIKSGHVILQGADVRGAIYGVYTFSEKFLGVPPLWAWMSWQPETKASVDIPADTAIRVASPWARWRICRLDDQDFLVPWRARSPENNDAVLETVLRLKMNAMGSGGLFDAQSYDTQQTSRTTREARDRGLAAVGAHTEIFGSSLTHWPTYWKKVRKQDPPKRTVANVEALEEFWRYHIETVLRDKVETVWLIGFRGHRDIPFWKDTFDDAHDQPATNAERAAVLNDMHARQIALLKKLTGDPAPPMHLDLWGEYADFFEQGLLRVPDEPNLTIVFCSALRHHFPPPQLLSFRNESKRSVGYYHNFEYTSSGAHLAQAQGAWRMEQSFRMVNDHAGRPLDWAMVNVGNMREFVVEMSAFARMMWDFESYRTDAFMQEFCAKAFGEANAKAASALYRDFARSYWQQKKGNLPGYDHQYIFYDLRYARALEQILAHMPKGRDLDPLYDWRSDYGMPVASKHDKKDTSGRFFSIVPADNGVDTQIEAIIKGTAESGAKLSELLKRADALALEIPERQRQFFTDNLSVQIRLMLHLNQSLHDVAQAMYALPDQQKAVAFLETAERSAQAARESLRPAEHGRFAGWFDPDYYFNLKSVTERMRRVAAQLSKPQQGP